MTDAERDVMFSEELARAHDELAAADALLAANHPRVALTRAYFAAFPAVRALLYRGGFDPQSHRGVHALFHAHFVRTGSYDTAAAATFARLQKYREEADYSIAFGEDRLFVERELAAARILVQRVVSDTNT
jgi:uncharacterized protein (UPF0332 family)